ncbi:hypothetical protein [Streptomyces sp. NPDC057686]|uniref:MmyB family transcriptional regulator n=1 Tax=Streptomyces sp. NPDC057686 TaxID=3346212 RepID=UPI0036BD3B07
MFPDPAARELYVEWPETARENGGMLRLYAGRHPQDPRLAGELTLGFEAFTPSERPAPAPRPVSRRTRLTLLGRAPYL